MICNLWRHPITVQSRTPLTTQRSQQTPTKIVQITNIHVFPYTTWCNVYNCKTTLTIRTGRFLAAAINSVSVEKQMLKKVQLDTCIRYLLYTWYDCWLRSSWRNITNTRRDSFKCFSVKKTKVYRRQIYRPCYRSIS